MRHLIPIASCMYRRSFGGTVKCMNMSNVKRSSHFRYFDGGISSVYMWDLDDGFAAVVLIKKSKEYLFNLF
jgi:hypothetical protein